MPWSDSLPPQASAFFKWGITGLTHAAGIFSSLAQALLFHSRGTAEASLPHSFSIPCQLAGTMAPTCPALVLHRAMWREMLPVCQDTASVVMWPITSFL